MHTFPQDNDDAAAAMGISEQELAQRQAFLQFGPDDAALLQRLNGALKGAHGPLIDAFYAHLHNFEETQARLTDPALVQRLKHKQEAYFDSITSGEYGLAYAVERLKIGLTHQRIGLKPHWYIGAYGPYLSSLLPEVYQALDHDAEAGLAASLALFKAILFDIELAIDAYFHADHEMLRLFAKVFESNIEGVLISDPQARILHANGKVAAITGHPPQSLLGRPLQQLIPPQEQDRFASLWAEVLAGGDWQGEISLQHQKSQAFPAWLNISGVKDDNGNTTHFVVEFSDISAYRDAQEALRQRTEELARSNQELERFAYVASHDLQEPLRMVASFTQLLSRRYKGKLDADADEFIGFAVDGATRMQALINDLLAFARVGTHGKPLASTDANSALQRALANLRLAIEDSGAQVQCDALPTVMADITQLTQLLQNLIGNAIKFRGEAVPQIRLSVATEDKEWLFRLQDNGIGIDAEFAERIFVIFQRLHTKEQYPGTGIGLAICKKIVERHGGRIWVESKPGSGAAFCFTLPKVSSEGEDA